MSLRMAVDRTRCSGSGVCAELSPDVISLDDWGYPMVAAGGVPEQLLETARLAVSSCPVMALRLAPDARDATTRLTGVSQPKVTLR